jgi:CRISPR/Cas system-associated exonuclease Cas4 (RecB family)
MYDSKLLSGDKLEKISIVIYLIKKMSDSKTVELNLESENLQVFKEELIKCVEEIFNKDIPFVQKQGDHCKWCPLNVICGM